MDFIVVAIIGWIGKKPIREYCYGGDRWGNKIARAKTYSYKAAANKAGFGWNRVVSTVHKEKLVLSGNVVQ